MTSQPDFAELARQLTGQVITPVDDGYDGARQMFYANFDRRPPAIARVADANDVVRVLEFTATAGVDVTVRSGGHSPAGSAVVDGAVVIDVRDLQDIDIDPDSRTVWAGSGVTAAGLTNALGEYGLALGFGDTGSVGIGGITLGGGVGFLSRKYGLTIDSLLAAEVVIANGDVIVADAENHPDLFWAIRGGGGNFGVVTRFKYSLQSVDRVIGGMLILPAAPETVAGFLELSGSAPDELSTIANVLSAPPMPFLPEEIVGKTVLMGLIAWCGDLDEGRELLGRFRALAEPLADFVDEIPYPQIYGPDEEEYRPTAIGRTGFVDSIEPSAIEAVLAAIDASDAPLRAVQFRPMGGAIARVDPAETAFAHRDREWMVNVASFYETEADYPRREAWVRGLFTTLTGGDRSGYVGFLDNEGEARVRAAYPGDTWDRLREVKAKFDPDNRFHHNQNIPPAE